MSGVYALAQGKTTNYYSDSNPAENPLYTMKDGDCWFCTVAKEYKYVEVTTPGENEAEEYIGKYVSPNNGNRPYFLVTEANLATFLAGEKEEIMTIIPGYTKAYERTTELEDTGFIGGVLYQ